MSAHYRTTVRSDQIPYDIVVVDKLLSSPCDPDARYTIYDEDGSLLIDLRLDPDL